MIPCPVDYEDAQLACFADSLTKDLEQTATPAHGVCGARFPGRGLVDHRTVDDGAAHFRLGAQRARDHITAGAGLVVLVAVGQLHAHVELDAFGATHLNALVVCDSMVFVARRDLPGIRCG